MASSSKLKLTKNRLSFLFRIKSGGMLFRVKYGCRFENGMLQRFRGKKEIVEFLWHEFLAGDLDSWSVELDDGMQVRKFRVEWTSDYEVLWHKYLGTGK